MSSRFKEAMEELKVDIFPKLKEILVVFVYGSVARGDYSLRHSDLDLFVVLNKKKISEKLKEKLNSKILSVQYKHKVKIHPEYQGLEIGAEDRTLVRKMIEEGKIIYSTGVFSFDFEQVGLKQFVIYEYSAGGKTMLSKVLHGRQSWYYKGKKKVVKDYKGLVDGETVVSLGKGVVMVVKEKEKDLVGVFENFGVEYKFMKIVYG